MAHSKKQQKSVGQHPLSIEDIEDLKLLSDALYEQLAEEATQTGDPFDTYTRHLQLKCHTPPDQFKKRFVKGYAALLEELSHKTE